MSMMTVLAAGLSTLTINPEPQLARFQREHEKQSLRLRKEQARMDHEIQLAQAKSLYLASALESLRNNSETSSE